jgi:ABC-2 type transport system permease protein
MASAFGLFLAALGRTPEATRGLAVFAVLILVMLGGAWVPAFVFPAWLQKATLLLPTRWAMDALDAVTWRGLGLASALPAVAIVLAFTLLFSLVAIWKFPAEES